MAVFKVQQNKAANRWEVIAETTEGRCVISHCSDEFLADMFMCALNDTLKQMENEPSEMAAMFEIRRVA